MQIDVIMVDNRDLSAEEDIFYNWTVAANIEACKKFNYNFTFYKPFSNLWQQDSVFICTDPNTGDSRHVAWSKILAAYEHLKNSNCEYVIYVDSDAFLLNKFSLLEYFEKIKCDKDIFFCNNLPWDPGKTWPCSGFFALKKTKYVFNFLEKWYKEKSPVFNKKHGWEQPILHQTYKNYDMYVDPEPTRHFVTEEDLGYSDLVHHITTFLVGNSENQLSLIKKDISRYYDLDNLKKQFVSNLETRKSFCVDPYSTLNSWFHLGTIHNHLIEDGLPSEQIANL